MRHQVIADLVNLTGSQFISFFANTTPKMRKTGNPYYGYVEKRAKYNGIVNFHYDAGVLRRLEKEGKSPEDFRKGVSWHEPFIVNGRLTPFYRHKKTGALYLRFQYQKSECQYYDTRTGEEIDARELTPFLQKSSYENQGLDKPLIFLTIALDNITIMKFGGKVYDLAAELVA